VVLVGVGTKLTHRLGLSRTRHAVKDKRGIVDAGEVARTRRLVVLGLDRKRVDVDRVVETRTLTNHVRRRTILQTTGLTRSRIRRELGLRVLLIG
jgi:hypothetical protein